MSHRGDLAFFLSLDEVQEEERKGKGYQGKCEERSREVNVCGRERTEKREKKVTGQKKKKSHQ